MADALLSGLNGAQRAAVSSPANVVQVLAPPGSGKTKTLTARVAYHIAHDGHHPRNIIVCTFTLKATREMRQRLEVLLGQDVAKKLVLGTFHSVARRFLVSYGKDIGLDPKFGIADTSDSTSIIKRIIENERGQLTIDPKAARNRISKLKAQGISPEQHLANSTRKHAKAQAAADDAHELTTVYFLYEEHLRINNLLDYDDLLLRCAELLRRQPSCVASVRAVLIDEFQDTNHVQFDLMTLFAQSCRKISTVGDPDQSIYGWRSADVTNLKRMRDNYPDLHVVNLEENYRSSGTILMRAQEVIEQDNSRPAKALMPTHGPGLSPVLRTLKNAFWEAHWIAAELNRFSTLCAGLVDWNDFAILLRSASLSRLVEQSLAKSGIPYCMVGGLRFFDRVEVKIILDYLRVIGHPQHSDALVRVLNVPSRSIGEKTMQGLLDEATEKKLTLWDLVLGIAQHRITSRTDISAQARKGITSFIHIMMQARSRLYNETGVQQTLPEFIKYILEKIELRSHIRKKYKDEDEARWANVTELLALAAEAECDDIESELLQAEQESEADATDLSQPATGADRDGEEDGRVDKAEPDLATKLLHFLSTVALSTDAKQGSEDNNGNVRDAGLVKISTIHAAKGLEWPVVFVPGCYNGSLPHSRAEDDDEERRLLYVAMTRAQGMLYISRPHLSRQDPQGPGHGATTELTRFITTDMIERFACRGPDIKTQDIHELSLILRRDCPSAVQVASVRATIEHALDNQLPEDPSVDEQSEKDYEPPEYGLGFGRKRKAPGDRADNSKRPFEGFKAVTTAFSGHILSTESATLGSFSRADVVALVETQESQSSVATARVGGVGGPGKKHAAAKRGRLDAGQQSISSFFAPPKVQSVAPEANPIFRRAASPSSTSVQPWQPLRIITNQTVAGQRVLARSSFDGAARRASKPAPTEEPPAKRSLIANPASRGKALTDMTRKSTLGAPPAQPGFKKHFTPGAFSRPVRE